MTNPQRNQRWFSLDVFSVFYLALPWFIFLGGWLRIAWAGIGAMVLLAGLYFVFIQWKKDSSRRGYSTQDIIFIALFALFWVSLSGLGGFGLRNPGMMKLDALMSELIVHPWPVVYAKSPIDTGSVLITSLGFLLPAALVGKLFGWSMAIWFQMFWAVTGVALALAWFVRLLGKINSKLVLFFILFGGLDIVGACFYWGQLPSGTMHLEWWSRFWQLPSHTALLFWSPQNAIPGWIATGLLIWLGYVKRETENLFFIHSLTLLWSPAIFVGLIPFVAIALIKVRSPRSFSIQSGVFSIVLLFIGAAYFSARLSVPSLQTIFGGDFLFENWPSLAVFCLLEFGFYIFLCGFSFPDEWQDGKYVFVAMVGGLLLFSTLFIGKSNEIYGQAVIPSHFLLSLLVIHQFNYSLTGSRRKFLGLLIFIGMFSAFTEISRSFSQGHFYPITPEEAAEVDRAALFQEEFLLGRADSKPSSFFIKPMVHASQIDPSFDLIPANAVVIEAKDFENISEKDRLGDDRANPDRRSAGFGFSGNDCLTYSFQIPTNLSRARLVLLAAAINSNSDLDVYLDGDFIKTLTCRFSGIEGNYRRAGINLGYLDSGIHRLCIQGKGGGVNLAKMYVFNDSRNYLLIEAEDNVNNLGLDHVQPLSYASGGMIIDREFGKSSNDRLVYEVNVDSDTEGGVLTVVYSTNRDGAALLPTLNGRNLGRLECPSTHDWFQFQRVNISLPPLKAGPYSFVLQSNGVNINLDYYIFKFN